LGYVNSRSLRLRSGVPPLPISKSRLSPGHTYVQMLGVSGRLPSSQWADKPSSDPASLLVNLLVSGRSSTNDSPSDTVILQRRLLACAYSCSRQSETRLLVTTQERYGFSGSARNWRWRVKVASESRPCNGSPCFVGTSRPLCWICIPVELKDRRHPSQASSHLEGGFPGRYLLHREDSTAVPIGRTVHSCVGSLPPHLYWPTHRRPRFAGFPGVSKLPCRGVSVYSVPGSQPLNAGGSQLPGASLIDPSGQRSGNNHSMSTYQILPAFRIKGSGLFIIEPPRTRLRRPAVIATVHISATGFHTPVPRI
jgi:hypothetical protein